MVTEMKRFLAFVVVLFATGCAVDPKTFDVQSTREIPAAHDKAWSAALKYLAQNQFQIRTVERASGVILADKLISDTIEGGWFSKGPIGDFADCGKEFMATPGTHSVQLNVLIEPKGAATASVVVTAKYTETYKGMNTLYGYYEPQQPKSCNSTGKLEALVFEAISTAN